MTTQQIEIDEACDQRKTAAKKNAMYTCPVCQRISPSNASWNQCVHCHKEYQISLLGAMKDAQEQKKKE